MKHEYENADKFSNVGSGTGMDLGQNEDIEHGSINSCDLEEKEESSSIRGSILKNQSPAI